MKNGLWPEEEPLWRDKWSKFVIRFYWQSFTTVVVVGRNISSLQKLPLKDLTFMMRSAIQLKYQTQSIKTPAPVTLTLRSSWNGGVSHTDALINVHSDTKRKGLFLCMCTALTFGFSSTKPADWCTACALFLSLLQSIYRSLSWWRCRTIDSGPCLPASSLPPLSTSQVLKCYWLLCC